MERLAQCKFLVDSKCLCSSRLETTRNFSSLYQYVFTQAQERADVCGVRLYVEGENDIAQAGLCKNGVTVHLLPISGTRLRVIGEAD